MQLPWLVPTSHGSWIALHKREQCLATNPWAQDQRGHKWEKRWHLQRQRWRHCDYVPHTTTTTTTTSTSTSTTCCCIGIQFFNLTGSNAGTKGRWAFPSPPENAASEEQASLFLQWSIFKPIAGMPRFKVDKTSRKTYRTYTHPFGRIRKHIFLGLLVISCWWAFYQRKMSQMYSLYSSWIFLKFASAVLLGWMAVFNVVLFTFLMFTKTLGKILQFDWIQLN